MGSVEVFTKDYAYVVWAFAFYCFVHVWMTYRVAVARKKYNVGFPGVYVDSENSHAMIFNCTQRGYQNSIEMMPMFCITLTLGGVKHPVLAAALGITYTAGRIFYFKGYSTGEPKNRMKGAIASLLAFFGLIGCAISFGVHLVN